MGATARTDAIGIGALFVAYFASAEFGCFLELGWALPVNVLDLYAEHRVETNGGYALCGNGLIGALAIRGLGHIDAGEKDHRACLMCSPAYSTTMKPRLRRSGDAAQGQANPLTRVVPRSVGTPLGAIASLLNFANTAS